MARELNKTTVMVSGKGLITRIPAKIIKSLDIKKGDILLWKEKNGEIVIKHLKGGGS